MKLFENTKTTLLVAAVAMLATACNDNLYDERHSKEFKGEAPGYITGIDFVKVQESAFTFNETPAGALFEGAARPFEVIQGPFWITKEPIPVSLYEAYFGKGQYPKNGLSFDQANYLLDRIYLSTGVPVVLPSEAMFEAAIQNGAINVLNKYNYLVDDGWGERSVKKQPVLNWRKAPDGNEVVLRGLYDRRSTERFRSRANNRLYIAIKTIDGDRTRRLMEEFNPETKKEPEASDGKTETVVAGGVAFKMIAVQGGPAVLGATKEQGKYAEDDEAPIRSVELKDFKIGETEVTAELWKAVMGYLPVGNNKNNLQHPVVNVSWFDACEFLQKLNAETGRHFRLPSEDEWEYAARGGRKSKGYIFAGSNNAQDVAVCTYKDKKGEPVRPHAADVKTKKPNELGIYDMSGNVWEWVQGVHPSGGCVQKSGSRMSLNNACRVSNRQNMQPEMKKDSFGFRIAL